MKNKTGNSLFSPSLPFSDFHVDYGMQNQDQTMRETNLQMLQTVKEKENPDVVLVGGDTVSDNGGQPWDEATHAKVVEQLTTALKRCV